MRISRLATTALLSLCCIVSPLATTVASAKTQTVRVFLAPAKSDDCTEVVASVRTIKVIPTPTVAMRELLIGTTAAERKQGFTSVFSSGTGGTAGMLKRVKVVKGVAYVNFTKKAETSLNNAATSCGRDMFFTQTEKTLQQFASISTVLFAVEGNPETFYSLLELVCPETLGKSCSNSNFTK